MTEGDERARLALQVIELARSETIAAAPFLAAATGALHPAPTHAQISPSSPFALAADGHTLSVNVERLLADVVHTRRMPTQAYLHVLLHALLLHPYATDTNRTLWDLACDIAVFCLCDDIRNGAERLTASHTSEQVLDEQRRTICRHLARELTGPLTTERLYHLLIQGAHTDKIEAWSQLFFVDDHSQWPCDNTAGERHIDTQRPAPTSERHDSLQQLSTSQTHTQMSEADVREQGKNTWQRLSHMVHMSLETRSPKRGSLLRAFRNELAVSEHTPRDYHDFLRQFASDSEEVHLSEDEFDYVFYTYGLSLYGDMPLIEPLEYRREHRVRDFAIVLDTSSSVTRKVIQDFIDTTYDVLTSTGGFFERVCIHIIQADQRVQHDTRITSAHDLDRWRHHIELRGMGGTDFRPAIDYVVRLQAEGEFDDLKGLIYFTDGWGIYPQQPPPFICAFVFYDEDHRLEIVPPWAEQLVLHPGEFQTMSVYGTAHSLAHPSSVQKGTQ